MSPETENFEPLRRLLKLKRYEQPPPGYFNDFSSRVVARIKLGEQGQDSSFLDRLLWDSGWLQRIWAAFEAKPVWAGAFGVAVCGLLITGVIYSDKPEVQPLALIPVTEAAPSSVEAARSLAINHPLLASPAMVEISSTNPISALQADGPSLGGLRAEPASFTLPGRN